MMRWICLLLLVVGCSHPIRPSKPMTDCRAAIAAFASADPAQIRGLPATCTLADVSDVLTSLDASSRGALGPNSGPFDVRYYKSEKLPQIAAWIDGTGNLALLDTESPPGAEAAYLAALGEPEARLDYAWAGTMLAHAELVWPGRGVLVIASSGVRGVVRVGVFAPTSLAEYESKLRYKDIETE